MRRLLFAFLALCCIAPIALCVESNEPNLPAIPSSPWGMLFSIVQRQAADGNASAQFNLGVIYADGMGVQQDYKEAFKWFTKVAEQGDAQAQFNLGLMYYDAKGVPQDYKEAVKWFTKAAEQAHAAAQHNLGLMYYDGKGVPQDYKQAFKWSTKAAEQGNASAQKNLGVMYNNGEGVPQDYKEAVKWFTKAAEQGHAAAQHSLGVMYAKGTGVPQDDKEAAQWYTKAAEQGNAEAQHSLGVMYKNGEGVPQDDKEAVKWYTKAAEQGYAPAQTMLGVMYAMGKGVPEDYKEAFKWSTKAAEQGYAPAQAMLGVMYDEGKGIPQDYKEAAQWYTKAAEQGVAEAQVALGKMYFKGEGVPEDYVTAYKWTVLAAVSGDPNSVKSRDRMKASMTQEQIAEAQRLAREFKPKVTASATQEPSSGTPDQLMRSRATSAATGFFITSDGLIVTASHAVEDTSQVNVLTAAGEKKARVVKRDIANDLALLKAEEGGYIPLAIKPSGTVKLGQDVFTLGFPNVVIQGFEPKFTKGSISSLAGVGDDPRYFQISVPVQPGNSGGPLIDLMGNVVGVVTAKLPDIEMLVVTGQLPQNVSYAVRSSFVLTLLETMPEAVGKLKSPNTKEVDQTKLVEQTTQSVVLVLAY